MAYLNIHYFETYYYANIIKNILDAPYNYIGGLNEFWTEDIYFDLIRPFPKKSVLHRFIEFSIDKLHYEDLGKININKIKQKKEKLWIEVGFDHYNLDYWKFDDYLDSIGVERRTISEDHVYSYLNEINLCGPYEDFLKILSEEIFFTLFSNRELLTNLNLAFAICNDLKNCFDTDEHMEFRKYITKKGTLKRTTIPKWAKRAVFYRDRGKCVFCLKDLTGLISIQNSKNYDHIVPLASGGLNDITNIQLLCEKCNKRKNCSNASTSRMYEKWYE